MIPQITDWIKKKMKGDKMGRRRLLVMFLKDYSWDLYYLIFQMILAQKVEMHY